MLRQSQEINTISNGFSNLSSLHRPFLSPPAPSCSAQTFWRHLQLLPSSGSLHGIHQQIHPTSGRPQWPGLCSHLFLDDCPISTHALSQSSTNSQLGSHDGPNGQSTSLICPKPFNGCVGKTSCHPTRPSRVELQSYLCAIYYLFPKPFWLL